VRASLALICLALSLTGCNRAHQKRVAVIPKGTSHIFWQSVQAGALAAGKEFHLQVFWNGPPTETDYSRQIEIVDSMIARRVDGIAVAAADRDALNNSLQRAADLHIPVVVFDSGVNSSNYITFVATDNYQAGQMAAQKLGNLLNGKGNVAEIMHAPGSASTMDRERGFENLMSRRFPFIHIVAKQYGMADHAKALSVTENILTADPNLDGLFASSEPSSVGAAQALKSRGLNGRVRFVAFDATQGLVDAMKDGTIDALVAQDPFRMGFEAVHAVARQLSGEEQPRREDLPATVVTKADLSNPQIHALLFPDLTKYLR